MIIGLDVDGVLSDFALQYSRYYERVYGKKVNFDTERDYNYPERTGKLWRLSGFFADMPVMEGAPEFVEALTSAGHDIVCITALTDDEDNRKERNAWLLGVFNIRKVVYAVNGRKKQAAEEAGCSVFIDDAPDVILSFDTGTVFGLRHPYNEDLASAGYAIGGYNEALEFVEKKNQSVLGGPGAK